MSASRKDKAVVGIALKPHGVRGEIKILPLVDSMDVFNGFKTFYLNDTSFHVKGFRINGKNIILTLDGVSDRDAAENIRGELMVKRSELPKLPESRHYVFEIIGLQAFANNRDLGVVVDVFNNNSTDILTIEGPEGSFMIPFLDKVVIDIEESRIILDEKTLKEVAVYVD